MQSVSTPTVGILVFRNNFQEVLLTKHKETAKHQTGKYGIPAGRLDPRETEIQALLREFNEETGEVENVIPIDWERAENFNPSTPKEIDELV